MAQPASRRPAIYSLELSTPSPCGGLIGRECHLFLNSRRVTGRRRWVPMARSVAIAPPQAHRARCRESMGRLILSIGISTNVRAPARLSNMTTSSDNISQISGTPSSSRGNCRPAWAPHIGPYRNQNNPPNLRKTSAGASWGRCDRQREPGPRQQADQQHQTIRSAGVFIAPHGAA